MLRRSLKSYALLSATALAGTLSISAHAQTVAPAEAAADAGDGDAIIVTGTRRSVSLQDAPINIAALSSEQIESKGIADIRDLANFTPGVTVLDTGSRSASKIVLRGLSANDTGIGGSNNENAVATYLGEVPLYLDFKLLDIDRVEVLLGPQGTLYGAGTLAGAIRYIPKRPNTNQVEGYVHLRSSTTAHSADIGYTGDAAFNIPIVADHVALRSVIGYTFEPGFIDYNYVLKSPGVSLPQPGALSLGTDAQQAANFDKHKDANFERTLTSRNTLLLQANDDLKAYLTYAYQLTKTDGYQSNSAGVLGTGKYERASRYLEPSRRESHLVSLELNANLFDFANLVSSTAYTKQKITSTTDNTDLLLDLDYDYELFPAFSSYAPSDITYKQFNQEIRLVSAHGGPFSWVLGGFYNQFKNDQVRNEYTPGYAAYAKINRPDDLEYISFVNSKTTEKAIFGEGTYQITPKWQFTAGGRYFKYEADVTGGTDTPFTSGGRRRTPYPLIQFDSTRVRSGSTSDDGFVWKLNSSYKISDELMTYVTFSKGYRIGGVNRVAPCVQPLPAGQNVCALPDELVYGPDKTKNLELGVRYSLFDRKLTGSLAVYHIDWDGIQVGSRTINGAVGITANAAKAVSKGIESNLTVRPIDHLEIQGTYSYNDVHLTAVAPGIVVTNAGRVDGQKGDRLPGSPKNSGSLGATYTVPFESGADLKLNWTAAYRGGVLTRIGGRGFGERIPAYVTHRVAATYATDKWDVSLFANNLFDKYAVTSVGQTKEQIGVNDGVVLRYYSKSVIRPRVLGVETRFRF
jgi:iron complex outermembrane receptor protein